MEEKEEKKGEPLGKSIEGEFCALRQMLVSLKLIKDMCYSDMADEEPLACIDVIRAAMGGQIQTFNLILEELSMYIDGFTYEPVKDGPA